MPAVVVIGAQWGDEGKGKVTDYLAKNADLIVRYQGGNNAGHTIVRGEETYKFHLVPSGILYPDKTCVLGNGVVIDAEVLIGELDGLAAAGIDTSRLKISSRAHLILPSHKAMDLTSEKKRGAAKIGTTGRGIGPAYSDKIARRGIRMLDAGHSQELETRVEQHFTDHRADLGECEWDVARTVTYLREAHARLQPHVIESSAFLNQRLAAGDRVLLEGAQGTLLDIDHGTYPFVTSSNPTAGGACVGAGIGPTRIDSVVGVSKAYATRVGGGPFPTELHAAEGEAMRKAGNEFGTTTGRPRRCGWVDLVALRYAVHVNGLTDLAITKLDVLDEMDELKICHAYRAGSEELSAFPARIADLEALEPVYQTMPGWRRPTTGVRSWDDLPAEARRYLSRIEAGLDVPVSLIGVGPDRDATLLRRGIWA